MGILINLVESTKLHLNHQCQGSCVCGLGSLCYAMTKKSNMGWHDTGAWNMLVQPNHCKKDLVVFCDREQQRVSLDKITNGKVQLLSDFWILGATRQFCLGLAAGIFPCKI